MTPQLEKVIERVAGLPESDQDYIAAQILELLDEDDDNEKILNDLKEAWREMKRGGGMSVEEYRQALESDD
jgi:predicted Zn-ribbon and HTH transcriptional regulator